MLAFFFLAMAMLMFVYMLCASRTNAVYVAIFFSLIIFFSLAAAAYWHLGAGNMELGDRLVVVSPLVIKLRLWKALTYKLNIGLWWHTLLY